MLLPYIYILCKIHDLFLLKQFFAKHFESFVTVVLAFARHDTLTPLHKVTGEVLAVAQLVFWIWWRWRWRWWWWWGWRGWWGRWGGRGMNTDRWWKMRRDDRLEVIGDRIWEWGWRNLRCQKYPKISKPQNLPIQFLVPPLFQPFFPFSYVSFSWSPEWMLRFPKSTSGCIPCHQRTPRLLEIGALALPRVPASAPPPPRETRETRETRLPDGGVEPAWASNWRDGTDTT